MGNRIQNELQSNTGFVEKITELLVEMKDDFEELSREISNGNPEILEEIIVLIAQIETDLLLQLRSELFDIRYVDVHKKIELLDKIKKKC